MGEFSQVQIDNMTLQEKIHYGFFPESVADELLAGDSALYAMDDCGIAGLELSAIHPKEASNMLQETIDLNREQAASELRESALADFEKLLADLREILPDSVDLRDAEEKKDAIDWLQAIHNDGKWLLVEFERAIERLKM